VGLLGLVPAAEDVVDGDQVDLGELLGVLGGNLGITRAVVVLGSDLLPFGGVEVVEVGFGDLARTALVDDLIHNRDGRFGEDGERGGDDVELVRAKFLDREVGFVLPGQQDVTDATFEEAVLKRSFEVPVVVDLWAPWCGPCTTLGPLLEQAVADTDGAVELAKVNVDENPAVSNSFQVQSIPAVFAVQDGAVVDQFIGARPDAEVRSFVAALAPARSEADLLAEAGADAGLLMTPVVDGGLLTTPPEQAVAAGSAASVPLLIGTNRDESAFFVLGSPKLMNLSMDGLRHWVRRVAPDDEAADRVVSAVLAARDERGESIAPRDLWSAIATEVVFRVGTTRFATAHASAAAPGVGTYAYLFTWESPAFEGVLGSCHALEIPFVFGSLDAVPGYTPGAAERDGGATMPGFSAVPRFSSDNFSPEEI